MAMETKNKLLEPIQFSVIVPVYDTERFIHKCIDSILAQTYPFFEIILVEDGSPDNCAQICDEYAHCDNRIRVIHKKNGGAASARNAGIYAAHGDYIIFSDSDDYWNDTTALQSISDAVGIYQCDVICTNLCKIDAGTKMTKEYFEPSGTLIGAKNVLLHERYISSPCSKIIKSELFSNGQLDFVEDIGSEDVDWSLRVALLSKHMVYMDISFYCYLQHDASSSHSMNVKKLHDLKNNTFTCMRLLHEQEEYMQKLLAPYVSYQYAILLFNIASLLDRNLRSELLSGLQEKCCYLQFSNSSKVRIMNITNKLLGFKGMMKVLSLYSKITKREIICLS